MEYIVNLVRRLMTRIAVMIDKLTRGAITPAQVTLVSFLGHFVFLWFMTSSSSGPSPRIAAVVLAFFGLMDALDGALARVQKSSSVRGMFLDAVSDRAKEVIVFFGVGIFIFNHPDYYSFDALLAVLALGTSQLVSYIKAKGEMAISGSQSMNKQDLNKLFTNGVARYEIRMTLLIIGLIFPILPQVLYVLIGINVLTAGARFVRISRYLREI